MKAILLEWCNFCRAHPDLFQFGQKGDASTFNGSTGCTHSNIQLLHLAINGDFLSQDDISRLCGYPWPENNEQERGMRVSDDPDEELNTCIRKLHLPYRIYFFASMTDKTWLWICERNNDGPILTAVNYPYLPRRKGLGLNGHAEIGGATQIGLVGGHSALRLGYDRRADLHGSDTEPVSRWHDWWHDPDHGSPKRPERPAFDRFLSPQGKVAITSVNTLHTSKGRPWPIMVAVPTKRVHPKGV